MSARLGYRMECEQSKVKAKIEQKVKWKIKLKIILKIKLKIEQKIKLLHPESQLEKNNSAAR